MAVLSVLDCIAKPGFFAPLQLVQLPRLATLELMCQYSSVSMAALSQLTSLTSLALYTRREWPPGEALAQLTLLQRLRMAAPTPLGPVNNPGQLDAAVLALLQAMLPALRQLTRLKLAARAPQPMPPAMAGLSQLRGLWLWQRGDPVHRQPTAVMHSHSLQGLRLLGVAGLTAVYGIPALTAMPALAELWLADVPLAGSVPPQQWDAFCTFVEQHPPLRHLSVFAQADVAAVGQQCARLRDCRPDLIISIQPGTWGFLKKFNEFQFRTSVY